MRRESDFKTWIPAFAGMTREFALRPGFARRRTAHWAALLILAALPLSAAKYEGGIPGAFLEQASGARALAMGRAFGAVAEGPGSLIWNPAGLGRAARDEFALNYLSLFEGASLGEISWASSYKRPFGLGASFIAYSFPGIVVRDASNNITGETKDEKMGFLFGGAAEPWKSWTFGMTTKLIRQSIGGTSASAVDLDFGVLKTFNRYRAGLQFQDMLEAGLKREGGEDKLPRGVRAGGAVRFFGSALFSADVLLRQGRDPGFRAGLEYSIFNTAFVRAGFDGSLPSMGLGLAVGRVGVDYAVLSSEALGLSHRMSLRWGFGAPSGEKMLARGQWKQEYIAKAQTNKQDKKRRLQERAEQLYKEMEAQAHAKQAKQALTGQQWEKAFNLSSLAVQKNPANSQAKEILDKSLAAMERLGVKPQSAKPPRLSVPKDSIYFRDPFGKNALAGGDSGEFGFLVKNADDAGPAFGLEAHVSLAVPIKDLDFPKTMILGDVWNAKQAAVTIPIKAGDGLGNGKAEFIITFTEAGRNPPDPVKIVVETRRQLRPDVKIQGLPEIDDGSYPDPERVAYGNADGQINPGDQIEIAVTLANAGEGETRAATARIVKTSDDRDIEIKTSLKIQSSYDLGNLKPGEWRKLVFGLRVAKEYKSTGVIPLALEVGDSRPQFKRVLPLNLKAGQVYAKIQTVEVQGAAPAAAGMPVLPSFGQEQGAAPTAAGKPVLPSFGQELLSIPAFKTPERKNAYAVVIGIENYALALPAADFALRDAQAVRDYFIHALAIPQSNIVLLLNDKATGSGMTKYLETWLANNADQESEVFVYYSGHGAPNAATKESYLVPYDGDPAYLESTGYSLSRLYRKLEETKAKRILVVMDSCFSGAGSRTVLAKGTRPLIVDLKKEAPGTSRLAVLAAAGGEQISGTFEEKQFGLMTYYFLLGLKGEAGAGGKGKIYLHDLYDFLKTKVKNEAWRKGNRKQEPELLYREPREWEKEPLAVLR
ncbi:MAG: caspase family protein [Elusimicrobia bacterium]|nr:caspase family protein [Elusimicrobiota bacterium]